MKQDLHHASVDLPLAGLRRRFAILLVLLTACPILRSWANPGDLDPDFGTGGKVTTDFHGFYDYIDSFVFDSSDRIVAAGGAKTDDGDGSFNFALARYSAAGVLDTSFGSGGKVTTDFSGWVDQAFSVAVDGSGRIVVSGLSYGANANIAVARYTAAGVLDTSFASGGKFVTDLSAGADIGNAVAIDGSGRIVVGGFAGEDFVLVRLTSTGALDTSFGGGGVVSADFGGSDVGVEIEIDDSGRILLAGVAGGSNFGLARFTSAGVLDSSFGSGGKVTTDFGGTDKGWSLAFDNDGRIIVAGWSDQDFAMCRYSASGVLDTSFGNGGKATTDFHGSVDECWSVVVDSNDNIVLAGLAQTGGSENSSNFALARYTSSGSLDATFGNGGKVTTNFNGGADHISCLGLDDAGNLIAAGRAFNSGSDSDFALARYFNLGEPEIALRVGSTSIPAGGSYNFATTNLGEEWTATVTISNDGAVPLTGIAAAITLAGNSDFHVGTPAPATTVPAGESRTFTLIFTPNAVGNRTGTLQVTSNAAPSPYIIQLSGTGIDTIDPVIAPQAADLTIVDGAAGNAAAISGWLADHGGAAATDNSGAVTWTHTYTTPPVPGNSVTIAFTARDASNNSATTAAELIVLDQTPPVITSPAADLTVNCSAPDKTAMVNAWLAAAGTAAATDNSGAFTWSHNFTTLPAACGTRTVIFTVGDASGNESTTSAVLTVVDTTAPVITAPAVSTTVESNGTGNAIQRNAWLSSRGGAAATDDCSGVNWSHNFTSLTHTLPQTVPVIFTVTDSCGNSSATTADFIIQDTTPPQITTQATDYYGDQDQAAADVADFLFTRSGAQATDIAGPITWSHNYNGTPPPVGGYVTVTFTATDTVGLTASTTCRLFLFPPGAVWIGPANSFWSVASNWRIPNGVLPDGGRDAYVDLFEFQNTRSIADGTFGVKNLYIGAGDQLDLAGSLTIHGNLISNAGLIRSRIEGDTSGGTRSLVINGQTTLEGPGRFLLAGAARNQVVPGTVAPQELTVAAGHEIATTADTVGGYQGTSIHARLVNHGTLSADGGGLNLYSQPKVNDGVFRAINGGYLEIQPPVDNTGGTVLAGAASTVVLQNTLTGGTVTGPGTLLINAPAGLTGPMLLDSNLTTTLQRWATTLTGTITNNGVMQFGLPTDTSTPYLHINGPVTVDGSGKIIFQGIGRRQILRANNAVTDVLTIGPQQEIITDHLTDSNYQSSSIHVGIVNNGTITADSGQLSLYSQPKTNNNIMRAINGGFLNMQADVDNTNGTLFAGPGSILYPQATITGGIVTGTGTLLMNANAGLAGPILLDNSLTTDLDGAGLWLTGDVTHNGIIHFGSDTSTSTAYMYVNSAVTLNGTGKIILRNAGRRQLLRANGAATDVLTVGPGIEITTDNRTGLNYQSSALHAPMIINGTVTANGGGLTIYSGAKTNNGTMRALNGGYMDFLSVTVTNYNATTDTLTGGRWEVVTDGPATTMDFSSSPIVNLAADTTVRLSGANATFPQLSTLRNISGTLVLENGMTLSTTGNMVIPGRLQFGLPAQKETTRLAITGNVDFTGTRIDVTNLGLASGSYLLATWTGTLAGTPVLASLPPGSQHSLLLDPVAKTLRLEVTVTPPVQGVSLTITAGTGADEGKKHISLSGQGAPDAAYRVEASTNLIDWTPVSPVLSSVTGALSWSFLQDAGFPRRFYRFEPE